MHKISVILPTYNGATRGDGVYLREAIESVLNQTYKNFELIIINDGSTDNTEDIIKEYKDKRIIYLKHNENKGVYAARNTGLKKATGEYIAFLDDDDYYYEDRLDKQIGYMIENNSSICLTNGDIVDCKGSKYSILKNKKIYGNVKDVCKGYINPEPSSVMMKKNIINHVGFFKEYLKTTADLDYLLRTAILYDIHLITKVLYAYRTHDLNMSSNDEVTYISFLFVQYELSDSLLPFYNNNKKAYNYDIFFRYMKWKYYQYNFQMFRDCFRITKKFGSVGLKWHIKYYLSYLPFILKILIIFKRKIKYA